MVTIYESPEEKKQESPTKLSPYVEKFLISRENILRDFQKDGNATIKVSEVMGSVARLYERVRNTVEYKGEGVLRRNAIERILKRLFWERGSDVNRVAQTLLRELIWAGYLKNNSTPTKKVGQIVDIINKYKFIQTKIGSMDLTNWLLAVTACEIEEAIDQSYKEGYVFLMYDWFLDYFEWTDVSISDHERKIQIYLAIHRALTKSDDKTLRYRLILLEYPDWTGATDIYISKFINNFFAIYDEIEKHIKFPARLNLYRLIQKHVAPFEILRTIVEDGGRDKLLKEETFERIIYEVCERKYRQIREKVNRGILRSIIYIFITKVIFALLVEIPYELYRFNDIRYIALSINVFFPPTLMWLIGFSISTPGQENTKLITERLKTVVYKNQEISKTPFSLLPPKRSLILVKIFSASYLLLFVLVFGTITTLLLKLNFTILGILIFFAFLSLVLLFGFRVRFTASELKVTPDRQGLISHLMDNLTLPFLSAGIYLSRGLSKINFLTIILDFLIEAPLKSIIEIVEEWTSFVREKKEEVIEIPEQ